MKQQVVKPNEGVFLNISSVAFIMYPVTDIKRSTAFYTDTLGLVQTGLSSETWIEFEIAGVTFGIGNFEQVGQPGSAQSLALETEDLVNFRRQLEAKGITTSAPYEFPGCFLSYLNDPDGNKIVLHQRKM